MKLALLLVAAVLTFAFAIGYSFYQRGSAVRAACSEVEKVKKILRADERQSLNEALGYRKAHPHGSPDIPLSLINGSIKRHQKNVRDLQPTDCSREGR